MNFADVRYVKENKIQGRAVREETIYWEWPYETMLDDGTGNLTIEEGDRQDTSDLGKLVTMSISAIGKQLLKEPDYVMIGETKITKYNAGQYYGKQVNYDAGEEGTVWRLFYVDFEDSDGNGIGKYGDAVGTIYIKADYNSCSLTRKLSDYSSSYTSSSDTKIEEMNPEWAKNRAKEKLEEGTDWNNNEKAAAYLCDSSEWKFYGDPDTNSNVNYAIGGPSVEMYIDSYNEWGQGENILGYEYAASNTPGYKYKVNGEASVFYMSEDILKLNAMYTNIAKEGFWWLASPSANAVYSMCPVSPTTLRLGTVSYDNVYGVSPVVSLRSNSPLEFED